MISRRGEYKNTKEKWTVGFQAVCLCPEVGGCQVWVELSTEETKARDVSVILMAGTSPSAKSAVLFHSRGELEFMKPNLEEFWKLKTTGIKEAINDSDDDQNIQNFVDTIKKTNRRHEVAWPASKQLPVSSW